jgi:hypothetical protein
VNHQRSAEIQALLEGIPLPASRDRLIAYASLQDAEAAVELREIAEREYHSLDEVGEQLVRTQPAPPAAMPLPKPESGDVPGGEEYTNPTPESGHVRTAAPPDYPASVQIEAQSETLKKQNAEQER